MTNPDLAALSEAYTKSPNALSLTLLGHALVDEYHAGRLVHIDEGMRERVALAMAQQVVGLDFDPFANPEAFDFWCQAADAAIAAMKGGAK